MTSPPAQLPSRAQRRVAYLNHVLPLLYPPPCAVGTPATPLAGPVGVELPRYRQFLILPDVRHARLLAPTGDARLTAGAVRHYSEPQSRSSRLKRQAVVAAVHSGSAGLLLRDRAVVHAPPNADHIERYLTGLLGRHLIPSIHIGPARANRKPVLQLLDDRGRSVAFAKLGINELTRDLVRAEARSLLTLGGAGFRNVRVPQVLATGGWHGHEVLVCSALPVTARRVPLDPARLSAAMREVSGATGLRRQRLADSRYWAALRARLAPLTDNADGRSLADAAHDLVAGNAGLSLEFGCWHGDWTPWNMASVSEEILLWDWERFTTGVPVGFDPLHYRLQSAIVRDGRPPRAAVSDTLAGVDTLLAEFRVPPPAARVTALLYLIDLAVRYLTDRQAEAGAALGVLGTWLLPELVAAVGALPAGQAPPSRPDEPTPTVAQE